MTVSVNGAEHPIVAGFHPDPTICQVDGICYLAHSSFEYSPGVPLFRSDDLTSWHPVGHALDGDPGLVAGEAGAGGGIYAPSLRHHAGRFWMITTNVSGAPGQLITSAPAIEGPWEPSRLIEAVSGIDPDLAWDDEGVCYLTYSSNTADLPGIAQVRVDLDDAVIVGEPRTISRGSGLAYPEGPHLLRRGDWWYLLYAEGGTERGHTVGIARAARPDGPFENHPRLPLLTRRSTTFPVQNTGHADLVELADGSWAMVYLGVRPRGTTPHFHTNGRETFVAGIDWHEDWPVVVPDRYAFAPEDTSFMDSFDGPLHPRWISPGRAPAEISAVDETGVTVQADPAPNGAPSMLATRTRDEHWRFTAETAEQDGAAVRVRMDERHWAEVRTVQGTVEAEVHIGGLSSVTTATASGIRALVIESRPATTGGPDDVVLAFVDRDGEHDVARMDGRYLSTEVAGGFVGRTVGVRAAARGVRYSSLGYRSVPAQRIDRSADAVTTGASA